MMRVTRSYSTKTWFDKQSITFIFVSLLILYLFPSHYLLNINLISGYVEWFLNIFQVFHVVASGSEDYESYAIYFALFSVLLPIYSYIYYKKPIKLNFDVIDKNKIYYFLVLTLFIPFIIVGIIISLTHWDEDYTFIFIARIISISSNSKIGLIFIFGGICLALAYFVAGYVTWVRYAMFSLLKTEDCSIKCSIISMSVSLLFIGLYFVVCIGIYSSTILMLIENLDGISSGEKLFIVFIVTVFLISTTLFIIACGVCWKHGIDLVAYCKRR